jgi:predicted porin
MKKLLIATAALAMIAGTAQAQSSVTIYGVLDIGVATSDNDGATLATQQSGSGLVNSTLVSNRLGFRGTEDLGGGLKANFVLEGAMDLSKGTLGQTAAPTSGPGSLTGAQNTVGNFNRGAWVGLSSATMGEIRLGRQDITNQSNFFPAVVTTAGNLGNSPIATTTADRDQVVNYISPTFQGFQLQVGHGSANSVTTTAVTEGSTGSVDAIAIQYAAGNLTVVAGQAEQKANAAVDNLKETMYGVKYNLGFAEVGGGIHNQKESDGGAEKKATMFSIAAPVKMLGSNVKAHFVYVDLDDVTTATSSTEAHRFALTKGFSKRTTGYAVYTSTKLKTATPTTPTSLIVGVAHTF